MARKSYIMPAYTQCLTKNHGATWELLSAEMWQATVMHVIAQSHRLTNNWKMFWAVPTRRFLVWKMLARHASFWNKRANEGTWVWTSSTRRTGTVMTQAGIGNVWEKRGGQLQTISKLLAECYCLPALPHVRSSLIMRVHGSELKLALWLPCAISKAERCHGNDDDDDDDGTRLRK